MKRLPTLLTILLISLFVLPVAADEVADDLAKARKLIGSERYGEAASVLEEALPKADALPEDVQAQARTAIHFYAGVAYSAMGKDTEAMDHIRSVLEISPEIRRVDPSKFDAHFVELFSKVRAENEGFGRFDEFYPGFGFQSESTESPWISERDPALEILGTRSEKRDWSSAEGEERDRVMADFWKARDKTPETEENEFREEFEQRVAFADVAFDSATQRGSLTDRGRVFTVLGEPARVRRRAIRNDDNIQMMNTGAIGILEGTIEYWIYTREQLPVRIPQQTVTFRFASHQGVGDNVLQKDGMAVNTLSMVVSAATEN